jgi:hypothetical protein
MNKIGLIVNINKYKHYFETSNATFVCDTIDNTKEKLINHLVLQFGNLNIDYPMDLTDFEYIWFKENYVNTNAFSYFIFFQSDQDTKWCQPWDLQEIYDEFLDKMVEKDSTNPPDFDAIYGEPNPDEEVDDKPVTMEQTEEIEHFEKKLNEIMTNAKNVEIRENQVKDCDCERCKEGYELQKAKLSE